MKEINLQRGNDKILPFEFLNQKKAKMLKKAAQPTLWQKIKSIFTSNKKSLNKMGPKKNKIVTLIDILENLFVKYDASLVDLLWQKKIYTPSETKKLRDDLTYLLPQIINYWVSFAPDPKRNMGLDDPVEDDSGFTELILSTCATDIFFANTAVFTLLSSFFPLKAEYVGANLKIQTLVQAILLVCRQKFKPKIYIKYLGRIGLEEPEALVKKMFKIYEPRIRTLQMRYGTDDYFEDQFGSSINFWTDILEVAKGVGREHQKPKQWKLKWIKERLEKISEGLPSFIFIPSQKIGYRNSSIMSIEINETRIFQTKTKTNFTLCLQIVKPEEFLMRSSGILVDKFEKKIKLRCQKITQMEQDGLAEKDTDKKRDYLHRELRDNYKNDNISISHPHNAADNRMSDATHNRNFKLGQDRSSQIVKKGATFNNSVKNKELDFNQMSVVDIIDLSKQGRVNTNSSVFSTFYLTKEGDDDKASLLPDVDLTNSKNNQQDTLIKNLNNQQKNSHSSGSSNDSNNSKEKQSPADNDDSEDDIIAENSKKQKSRIKKKSLYSVYYTWNLATYMVKSGDDVRQEQFAMQLIFEISNIFARKKLKLKLTPYEIIPIGPEGCLVEMVTDATSIDGLKKVKIHT